MDISSLVDGSAKGIGSNQAPLRRYVCDLLSTSVAGVGPS